MNEFKQIVLGGATAGAWLATLLYAYLTAFGMILYSTTKRDPKSENTPVCFHWSFLLTDKALRIYSNLLFIIILVRVTQFFVPVQYIVYSGFLIGLLSDGLGQLLEFLRDMVDNNVRGRIRNKFMNDNPEKK
jgi:hypothetical protein